jgi:hypothetical protein
MVLAGLQALLQKLYDVDFAHDVQDFLITDRDTLKHVSRENEQRDLEEELLLGMSPEGDAAELGLYLDAELLRRLEQSNPMQALTEENIRDYCTALEGVSHFLYASWRLSADLPVSLLELETQAEVDKYAVTVFLMGLQQGGPYPREVHARLFDRVSFDVRLDAAQYERYRSAHLCAANFCRRLERRFVNRGVAKIEALVRELRKFYRLKDREKLRYALA